MYMYIKGLAAHSEQLKSDIRSKTGPVIRHLIKVFLYPNAQENNKWKREVARYFYNVDKIKSNKRYPSALFIYKNSWSVYEDSFDRWVIAVIADMEEDPIPYNFNNLYSACDEYFKWLSEDLSKHGVAIYNEIYQEIELLRDEYM